MASIYPDKSVSGFQIVLQEVVQHKLTLKNKYMGFDALSLVLEWVTANYRTKPLIENGEHI